MPVTRQDAIAGLRALALLSESGQLGEREAIVAADNIFIDMGLGYVSLPYLEIKDVRAVDFLGLLRVILDDEIEMPEPFHAVGPYWPFAY